MGIAVGLNTVFLSLLNAIVLRPIDVTNADRLVSISRLDSRHQLRTIPLPMVDALLGQLRSFTALSAYFGGSMLMAEINGSVTHGTVELVSGEYFKVLDVRPLVGRLIDPTDTPPAVEAASVVVLNYRFWQKHFNGDPAVVGQTIRIENVPVTVIGVAPANFAGLQIDIVPDFTLPIGLLDRLGGRRADPRRPTQANNIIARLAEGATIASAQSEMSTAWSTAQRLGAPPGMTKSDAAEFEAATVRLDSATGGFSFLRTRYAATLKVLFALSNVLLVLACLNLAGLFVAREATRRRNTAIRLALGATRAHIVQRVAVEILILSAVATALAWPVATQATKLLRSILWSGALPLTIGVTPDGRVLILTAVIAIVSVMAICVGVSWSELPAQTELARKARIDPIARKRGRSVVVVQVALSLSLLCPTILLMKSLKNLRTSDTGFQTTGVTLARLLPLPGRLQGIGPTYYRGLVDRLQLLPGVRSVALSDRFPYTFDENGLMDTAAELDHPETALQSSAVMEVISPRFFDTVHISLLEGRDFSWQDDDSQVPVAIVNSTLARQLFPAGSALGRRIRFGSDSARSALQVVGVVRDFSIGNVRASHLPLVFRPLLQEPRRTRFIEIRTDLSSSALVAQVDDIVNSLRRHSVVNFNSLHEQVEISLLRERFFVAAGWALASVACLLAAVGIYSVLAYSASSRRREIGIRMALGASRSSIVRLIVGDGLRVTLIGIALGIPAALAANRITSTILFGVQWFDAQTIIAAASILIGISCAASSLPAFAATKVDPNIALRVD